MNASRVALGVAVVCAAMGCHDTEEPLPECGEGRICTCEPGDDSPGCNPCQVGYRPALSGTACVPTCSAPDIDCGQYGVCEDTASGAECRCDPGHTGEDCTRCVAELAPNESGRCVAELSAPALLTLSVVNQERMLGQLVPPGWSFQPLAPVPGSVTDVAYEQGTERIYALDGGRLALVDLGSGELSPLSEAGVDLGGALCLDQPGRRALTASTDAIYAVDLDSFEVTDVAPVGARSLEYDASRARIVGVDSDGNTFELSSEGTESLGPAPELASLAMAFDPKVGRAYFTGNEAESADDRLLRYCTQTLARLGAVPAWRTSVVVDPARAEVEPIVVDHPGPDAALLVLNPTETGFDAVQIEVAHPGAAVCLVDDRRSEAALEVRWASGAGAAFTFIAAPNRPVRLEGQELIPEEARVIVYSDPGLTVAGPSDRVTEHDRESWEDLALSPFDAFPARSVSTLVLMDWASRSMLPIELPRPVAGAALAWIGEVP